MAWNQGIDLYGEDDNRFLKGAQYVAKYNLGEDVPFTRLSFEQGAPHVWSKTVDDTKPSADSRGNLGPIWAMIQNHYVNRRGLAAPSRPYAPLSLTGAHWLDAPRPSGLKLPGRWTVDRPFDGALRLSPEDGGVGGPRIAGASTLLTATAPGPLPPRRQASARRRLPDLVRLADPGQLATQPTFIQLDSAECPLTDGRS